MPPRRVQISPVRDSMSAMLATSQAAQPRSVRESLGFQLAMRRAAEGWSVQDILVEIKQKNLLLAESDQDMVRDAVTAGGGDREAGLESELLPSPVGAGAKAAVGAAAALPFFGRMATGPGGRKAGTAAVKGFLERAGRALRTWSFNPAQRKALTAAYEAERAAGAGAVGKAGLTAAEKAAAREATIAAERKAWDAELRAARKAGRQAERLKTAAATAEQRKAQEMLLRPGQQKAAAEARLKNLQKANKARKAKIAERRAAKAEAEGPVVQEPEVVAKSPPATSGRAVGRKATASPATAKPSLGKKLWKGAGVAGNVGFFGYLAAQALLGGEEEAPETLGEAVGEAVERGETPSGRIASKGERIAGEQLKSRRVFLGEHFGGQVASAVEQEAAMAFGDAAVSRGQRSVIDRFGIEAYEDAVRRLDQQVSRLRQRAPGLSRTEALQMIHRRPLSSVEIHTPLDADSSANAAMRQLAAEELIGG